MRTEKNKLLYIFFSLENRHTDDTNAVGIQVDPCKHNAHQFGLAIQSWAFPTFKIESSTAKIRSKWVNKITQDRKLCITTDFVIYIYIDRYIVESECVDSLESLQSWDASRPVQVIACIVGT